MATHRLIIPIFVVGSIKAGSFNGQGESVSVTPWTDFIGELASRRHNREGREGGKCAAASVNLATFAHVLTVSSQITRKPLP